jgi:hypothetical protein
MAAGLGFKTFTTGEVLTAADTNGYLMQGVLVFASSAARASAVTSPQEGQYSYLKDTNSTEYYDGAAWIAAPIGDITGVTAGTGISGGGTSGTVTITNSMATEITAKGDLIVGTGSATFDNLTAGNNGETLVADSSTSTGLRYTPGNPISNPIINSCFDIWQRGTTATIGTNTYAADRWICFRGGYAAGMTVSRQSVNDSTNLPNIQFCSRVQRDSGNTSTQGTNMQYWQETANSVILAGKTVTLSFYARAGANYSTASSTLTFQLYTGTGTDQNGATVSYTGAVAAINTTATLTTTWQRFSATVTLATNTNEYGVAFSNTPVGIAGANDYYEVTGVQIDQGSVALPIRRNGATFQGELAACQRYYYRQTADSTATTKTFGWGYATGGSTGTAIVKNPVTMRVTPTSIDYSNLYLNDGLGSFNTMTTITVPSGDSGQDNVRINLSGGGGGLTTKAWYWVTAITSTSFIGFSAEL